MRKTIITVIVLLAVQTAVHAQAAMVFDPTNYLVAIDQLYSTYDQVMNTIQQIKYTYEQLQHYYNEAKTWNLEAVNWDGDWDFRNEIRSVTRSVDRQITNIRMMEHNLTKRQIAFGGQSFTLKDLTDVKKMGNILASEVTDNLKQAASGFAGRLTEREKAAIWRKYGLSPVNYYYVRAKENDVRQIMNTVRGWGMEESIRENMEAGQERNRLITENAMSEDSTEKSLLQQQIVQNGILLEEVYRLETLTAQVGAMTAAQQGLENQEKEARQEQLDAIRMERMRKNNPGSLF
jgi:hypothetical protein